MSILVTGGTGYTGTHVCVGLLQAGYEAVFYDDFSSSSKALSTGVGYGVLDVVKTFMNASGQPISYQIAPRCPGDLAACYADSMLAKQLLGWKTERAIIAMCQDHWNWQKQNPRGYLV